MDGTLTLPQPLRHPLVKNTLLGLLLLAVTLGAVTMLQANLNAPLVPAGYVLPRSPEIEERFGVRFTFVAVTANGGFVDLRYRIVDTGKARNFGHYTETSPMLINEETGDVIDVTRMGLHNHRVEPGRIYYVLFRNTDTYLERGDRVTIQVGDLQLENVIVQ